MVNVFDVLAQDFASDLSALGDLVRIVESESGNPKARVASINSATLLLAATFEEFVREMARNYAKELVRLTPNYLHLPRQLSATAWKRTLEDLARAKVDTGGTPTPLSLITANARSSFEAVCKFLEGDTTQDIYTALVHNENNMRPNQINSIFKICNLNEVCLKISESGILKEFYEEDDSKKVHGKLLVSINDFVERRNSITHALNASVSASAHDFENDIKMLNAFANALAYCLPSHLPELVEA
jgi:hypothetical protein